MLPSKRAHSEADPVTSVLCLQLHLPFAASSLIFQQFLTQQQLPSVQASKECSGKAGAFHNPCVFCGFVLLFHLTGRSTEDKTDSIRL